MDTRHQLVEEWKAKCEASSQSPPERGTRFAWVRQIYSRIYRFLISSYGTGNWRGAVDDSDVSVDSRSITSRMPFVDHRPSAGGLVPKTGDRIRATLESIHNSNPGIVTAGKMSGVEDGSWVVVDARKKSEYARAVHRGLVAYGIEARLQNRATDTAVAVRHVDFQKALTVVESIGRPRRIRSFPGVIKWSMEPNVEEFLRTQNIRVRKSVDPIGAVGIVLLYSSIFTFIAIVVLFHDTLQRATPVAAAFALWVAGLLASWLCVRSRRDR